MSRAGVKGQGHQRKREGGDQQADDATFASLSDDSRRLQCKPGLCWQSCSHVIILYHLLLFLFSFPPLLLSLFPSFFSYPSFCFSSPLFPFLLPSTAMLEAQGHHLIYWCLGSVQYILQNPSRWALQTVCTCTCRKCTIYILLLSPLIPFLPLSLPPHSPPHSSTQHLVLSNYWLIWSREMRAHSYRRVLKWVNYLSWAMKRPLLGSLSNRLYPFWLEEYYFLSPPPLSLPPSLPLLPLSLPPPSLPLPFSPPSLSVSVMC